MDILRKFIKRRKQQIEEQQPGEPDTFDSYYEYVEWVAIHTGTHIALKRD